MIASRWLAALGILLIAAFTAAAADSASRCRISAGSTVAVRSGPWGKAATWGGALPARNARVVIPAGLRVTLDVDPPPLKSLFIAGSLRFAPRNTRLTTGAIMVHGTLQAGTPSQPFLQRATITLTGRNPAETHVCSGMNMGAKVLSVMKGGRLLLHGPLATSWTHLVSNAPAGSRTITVEEATGWAVGDTLVLAPRVATPGQTEKRRVQAISGPTVTLDRALNYTHDGTRTTFDGRTFEMRSEVGRLDRRIVIQGDADSVSRRFGGQVMVMEGGVAQVNGVEFRRMGQFNRLGRYPFHWHLVGNGAGQYLKNSSVHESLQRGVVVHGTRNVLVEGNVVYDSPGHNYAVEDPSATGNVFRGNLALENRVIVLTEPTLAGQRDNQVANFWIRSARNTFVDNAAAASMATGFWYDGVSDGPTEFAGNVGHSSYSMSINNDFVRDAGLLVENVGSGELRFRDSVFYQNGIGIWPTESGAQRYDRMVLADHWRGPAMTMDASGAMTRFDDCLVVGRTRALEPADYPVEDNGTVVTNPGLPAAFFIQYSGLLDLRNPVFVNYGSDPLLFANDIFVEWQAEFFVRGARFINTAEGARNLHDLGITTLLDSTYGPPGTYVQSGRLHLAEAGNPTVLFGEDAYLQMAARKGYASLFTSTQNGSSFPTFHDAQFHAVRSDGLRFSDEDSNAFRVICGGEYRYHLEQSPTAPAFFVTLDNHGTPMPEGVAQTVVFSVPLAAAPSSVARIDDLNEDTVPAAPGSYLTPAASQAAFDANPDGTFYYSSADGRLYLQADARWLIVTR